MNDQTGISANDSNIAKYSGCITRMYWDHNLGSAAPLDKIDASAETQTELLAALLDGALSMYWQQVSNGLWTGTGETEICEIVRCLRDGATSCKTESFAGNICVSAPDVWTPMDCPVASKINPIYGVE